MLGLDLRRCGGAKRSPEPSDYPGRRHLPSDDSASSSDTVQLTPRKKDVAAATKNGKDKKKVISDLRKCGDQRASRTGYEASRVEHTTQGHTQGYTHTHTLRIAQTHIGKARVAHAARSTKESKSRDYGIHPQYPRGRREPPSGCDWDPSDDASYLDI